jgi:hypothetical protein
MSDDSNLRVGESERDRAVAELREHMVAGRLTTEELEQRIGAAYAAGTRSELAAVAVDLPISPVARQRALSEHQAHLRRRLLQEGGGAGGVSLICVVIWIASGASGDFWPLWVILATSIPFARDAWRLRGPAPDLEAVQASLDSRRNRRLARERRRSDRKGLPR